jgi:hypothetical protein
MSDVVEVAVIISIAPTLAACTAAVLGYLNRTRLVKVEKQVNGRLTELLELTRRSSRAEGVKAELDRPKDQVND